jgi:hypothetical protein
MKPAATAIAAALISGVAMYTVGARTASVGAFAQAPLEETTRAGAPARSALTPMPAATPRAPQAAARTQRARVAATSIESRDARPERSWSKSALIIGGSAASGAGVGAVVNGKKGALIGAAIGGGAASIYEATRRR